MKNLILLLLCTFILGNIYAQREPPLKGMQYGITAGGFMSALGNADDMNADGRLDPKLMFNYGGGIEIIKWMGYNFGIGTQVNYWMAGMKYTGFDTLSKLNLDATTSLTYIKLPVMLYYRSYNRYYPERKLRFNIYMGPYIALMQDANDSWKITNADKSVNVKYETTQVDFSYGNGIVKGKVKSGFVYEPIDLGFVFGMGVEYRLWRRTTVALSLRTDIGATDVEHKGNIEILYNGTSTPVNTYYWGGLYSKYVGNSYNDPRFEANRPATKNFAIGGFLSIRRFIRKY